MFLNARTFFKAIVLDTFRGTRYSPKRRPGRARIVVERLEARLLLTDPQVGAVIEQAQSSLYNLSETASTFGTEADSVYEGLGNGMTNFGTGLTSIANGLQGVIDLEDSLQDAAYSFGAEFESLINGRLSEIVFPTPVGDIFIMPGGENGGSFMISGQPVSGSGYLDGSFYSLTFNDSTETTDLAATIYHSTFGNSGELSYEWDGSDGNSLTLLSDFDSTGIGTYLTLEKTTDTSHILISAGKDTRPYGTTYLNIDTGFETPEMVFDASYRRIQSYMIPSGDVSWRVHIGKNIGENGHFTFDTMKNSFGNSSRIYLVNKTDTASGGILARVENDAIAVGTIFALKNAANTWDATATAYAGNAGVASFQSSTPSYVLTDPLDLGNVNVIGVGFSGEFNFERQFHLINFRPNATATFIRNQHPILEGTVNFEMRY